jgi:hypothetical protein
VPKATQSSAALKPQYLHNCRSPVKAATCITVGQQELSLAVFVRDFFMDRGKCGRIWSQKLMYS